MYQYSRGILARNRYMNRELQKAICTKQMLQNKFEKYRSGKTWEKYRKQRNLVTKLKRKSVNTYCQEGCAGGKKLKDLYSTVKPFIIKKNQNIGSKKLY